MSVKSSLGHSEAGAGALGILRMAARLTSQDSAPLAHLCTLNPHVLGILEFSQSNGQARLPRQVAPRSIAPLHAGVSSFAFQVRCLTCLLKFLCNFAPRYPEWMLWHYVHHI